VETGNPRAWIEAIRLLGDRERVARYSQSSFEASSRFLDREEYSTRLLSIYEKASRAQENERLVRV
jgi:hypothetical protein